MARRFIFTLQPVLDKRLREEEERQRVVAALERERLGLEQKIRDFQRGITAAKEDLRGQLGCARGNPDGGASVSLAEVRMQANASLHLVARAQQAVLELAGLHQHLDAARLELVQATAARKAVELLKARRLDEWKREQAMKEAAALDELTTMRHAREQGDAMEDAA